MGFKVILIRKEEIKLIKDYPAKILKNIMGIEK
jgi:hypothetical protein